MINAVRITNKFKWDYKSQKYHKSHHANGRVFGFLMCIYSPCSHVWWNLKKKIVNILQSVFISVYKILLVTNCCISSTFMNTCIYITVNSNFEGITRSQIFCNRLTWLFYYIGLRNVVRMHCTESMHTDCIALHNDVNKWSVKGTRKI